MPKQKGIIRIKGSMGGITFYKSNGQNLSKETSGPSKSKIMGNPRIRENTQEFGGTATIGKALRLGLVKDFKEMSDSGTSNRLNQLIRKILNHGSGTRGQRAFQPAIYPQMFVGFNFTLTSLVDSIFKAPYTVTAAPGRNAVTLDIPDFNAGNYVKAPQGATHFRIINHITVLSAFSYNPTTGEYIPEDAVNNSVNDFEASDYIPVEGNVGKETSIVASLPGSPSIAASSVLITCIGIEFYQDVNGAKYLLSSNNAMKIHGVF